MADRVRTISATVVRLGALCAGAMLTVVPARAQIISKELPEQAQGVEVQERLGERIPRPLMVQSSDGLAVDLWDYFDGRRPVILALGYYTCPLICPLTFETLVRALNGVNYTAGEDFQVLAVSFDPSNTVEDAREKKIATLTGYDRPTTPEIERGFLFSIASESNARRLADAVGYRYKKLSNGEYSHPVALVVLTPDGRVSRYIYSFDYTPRDIKLAMLEATRGRIGKSIGDSFLHFCFAYNPQEGAFTLQAMRVMQLAGVATMILLGGVIGGLLLTSRLRGNRKDKTTSPAMGVAT